MKSRIIKGSITMMLCVAMVFTNIYPVGATVENIESANTEDMNMNIPASNITSDITDAVGDSMPVNNINENNTEIIPETDPATALPAAGAALDIEAGTDAITGSQDSQSGSGALQEPDTVSISENQVPLADAVKEPKDEEAVVTVSGNSVSGNQIEETEVHIFDDEVIHVEVTVSKTAFPDTEKRPELKVDEITESKDAEKYQEIETDLLNQISEEEQLEGFKPYDIRFEVDGVETEPIGGASVTMSFHEDIRPETVTDEASASLAHHVEASNAANAEKEIAIVAEEIQDASSVVKEVSFDTETFSTFTIYWSNRASAGVICIERTGTEIGGDTSVRIGKDVVYEVNSASHPINGYSWLRAVVYDYSSQNNTSNKAEALEKGIKVTRLKRNGSTIQYAAYDNANHWVSLQSSQRIYFIYQKGLTEIETVDSISKHITINVFDYDKDRINKKGSSDRLFQFGSTKYGSLNGSKCNINAYTGAEGGLNKNIVANVLGADGYPILKGINDISLNYLFDKTTQNGKTIRSNANHLFSQAYFDAEGYYYYSSLENFASLDSNQNFKVYEQIGTPSEEDYFYYQRGNFLPLNTLKENEFSNQTNRYYEYGKIEKTTDIRYGEQLYKLNGSANYHFGMVMDAAFSQPGGGQINNKDMVFEFTGDDDVWVFIDDVLVLDIGGIHDCYGGKINFKTGEIHTYVDGQTHSDTILECFTRANRTADFSDDRTNTFQDYTTHKIKFFYLERGSGASNCKLKFNLYTIPNDTIEVEKQVAGINESISSDRLYGFKVYTNNKVLSNTAYSLFEVQESGEEFPLENQTTNKDGIFYLKANQKAKFSGIKKGTNYYVEEVNADLTEIDKVTINDQDAALAETIRSSVFVVGNTNRVVFLNHIKTNDLIIEKQLLESMINPSIEEDRYGVQLYQIVDGKEILYAGEYYLKGSSTPRVTAEAEQHCMWLQRDDQIIVKQVPAGTKIKIIEMKLTGKNGKDKAAWYEAPLYMHKEEGLYGISVEASSGWDTANTTGAIGTTVKGKTAYIIVKNQPMLGKIIVTKKITEAKVINGDPIFTIIVTNQDTKLSYAQTVRFASDDNGQTKTVEFDDLPAGTYEVKELDTVRYQFESLIGISGKVTVNGEKADVIIDKDSRTAKLQYTNRKDYKRNYSHTDEVINEFVKEGNKIVIRPKITRVSEEVREE